MSEDVFIDMIEDDFEELGKRGGSRPGAGRRKKPDKRVCLTVSLPPENKAAITSAAKADGLSASELVRRWSDALIPRTQSDTTE